MDKAIGSTIIDTDVVLGYEDFFRVLTDALNQTSKGKGEKRHGFGIPFDEQPIHTIPKLLGGPDFLAGQIMKKLHEARFLDSEAAYKEMLGAIVYCVAMAQYVEENNKSKTEMDKEHKELIYMTPQEVRNLTNSHESNTYIASKDSYREPGSYDKKTS